MIRRALVLYVALFSVLSCYALLLLCYYLLRGL